jgi:hypothetical protein
VSVQDATVKRILTGGDAARQKAAGIAEIASGYLKSIRRRPSALWFLPFAFCLALF